MGREKSKVYCVQDIQGFDLAPAEAYGELVFLFPSKVQIIRESEGAVVLARDRLKNYKGDNDYFLPTGDPILMIACGYIAAQSDNGHLRVLKWDKYDWGYNVVDLWLESVFTERR